MAVPIPHPLREVEPEDDGRILCPDCMRPVGSSSPEADQWYCRHCKLELVRKRAEPHCSLTLQSADGSVQASLTNLTKLQLLAMYLANDTQAEANRAKALKLIEELPDE